MLCNSKLEKVLLEHGSQVMRVAGLETAHTHYLADRVKGERERQVLQHVTGEISAKLVELANTSAAHEGQVSVLSHPMIIYDIHCFSCRFS